MAKRQKLTRGLQSYNLSSDEIPMVFPWLTVREIIVLHNVCWDWRDLIEGLSTDYVARVCDAWLKIHEPRSYTKLFALFYLFEHKLITRKKYVAYLGLLEFKLEELENSVLMQLGLTERREILEKRIERLPEQKREPKKRVNIISVVPCFVQLIQDNHNVCPNSNSLISSLAHYIMSDQLYYSFIRMGTAHYRVLEGLTLRQMIEYDLSVKYFMYILPKLTRRETIRGLDDLPYIYESKIPYVLCLAQTLRAHPYIAYCLIAALVRLNSNSRHETPLITETDAFLKIAMGASLRDFLLLFVDNYHNGFLRDSSLERLFKNRINAIEGLKTYSKQLVRVLISLKISKDTTKIFFEYCKWNASKWGDPGYNRVAECIQYALEKELLLSLFEKAAFEEGKNLYYAHAKLFAKLLRLINWQHQRTQNPIYDITPYVRFLLEKFAEFCVPSKLAGFVGLTYSPDRPPDEFFRWQPYRYLFDKGSYAYNYLVATYKPSQLQ